MTASARYLYAITRDVDPAALGQVTGIAGRPVTTVTHRDLTAVVGEVDLAEFGEDALRQNLESLEWLEEVARAHDDVIRAVAALGPTAPLRLATICLDDDGVRARLAEWREALVQALDRVEGRDEWSVKVFTQAQPEPVPAGAGAGTGSGADYLRRKKEATQARAQAEENALRAAEDVYTGLSERAAAGRRLPAQDPRLSGHEGTMLLNSAFLVDRAATAEFQARLEEVRAAHPECVVDCHGPWPPYSFATLEQR